jgi:hypothetical protein
MMITRSTALKNARASVHISAFSGGQIAFYDGAMPLGGADSTDQVLLCTIDLPDPSGSVDAGVFTLVPNLEAMVLVQGTPTWCRITDSASDWVQDMDVGIDGSGAAVIVTPGTLYAGGSLRIERLRLIEP